MPKTWRKLVLPAYGAAGVLLGASSASATILFSDDFTGSPSPAWGNELGMWRDINGAYDASLPHSLTYTSVTSLPSLADFSVSVTVNDWNDGGLWLRSSYNSGAINGILLVTGGDTGSFNGYYFHEVHNGVTGAELGKTAVAGLQGSTENLRVAVSGNTYSVFLGGSATPTSVFVDSVFSSGSFGLYDNSPIPNAVTPVGEAFDNVCISDTACSTTPPAVPEPASLAVLGAALFGFAALRRRYSSPTRRTN